MPSGGAQKARVHAADEGLRAKADEAEVRLKAATDAGASASRCAIRVVDAGASPDSA